MTLCTERRGQQIEHTVIDGYDSSPETERSPHRGSVSSSSCGRFHGAYTFVAFYLCLSLLFVHTCPMSRHRAMLKYKLPLREVVVDFYNQLKSLTSGYASFDYEEAEYVKPNILSLTCARPSF